LKEGKLEDLDRTGMVELCKLLFTEDSLAEYENLYFKELAKVFHSLTIDKRKWRFF
jgi:hypothetical protein